MKYRREIDGLRAVAVLPVILFHAGFAAFSGGYVGVDVFFVISGFLITTIIADEQDVQRFSIVKFYERRARRILPALFTVLAASVAAAWAIMLPADLKNFGNSLISVTTFLSNFFFVTHADYFASEPEIRPLLHTWSLAVEEQYYIFFPLLLAAIWRWGRRTAMGVVGVLLLASLAIAQWTVAKDANLAYFLLHTRGWELMIGALLAIGMKGRPPQSFPRGLSEVGALAGLGMIATSTVLYTAKTPFPGVWALLPTVGAALILAFAHADNLCGRLLGSRPMVDVGLISYSAYLWHQPVLEFARELQIGPEPIGLRLGLIVLTLALAWLSWRYIEAPFRTPSRFSRAQVFGLALACSVVAIGIGLTLRLELVKPLWTLQHPGWINQNQVGFDRPGQPCPPEFRNLGGDTTRCLRFGQGSHRVVLWGDSHGYALSKHPPEIADTELITLTHLGCPPVMGVRRLDRDEATDNCTRLDVLQRYAEVIRSWRPETVVLVGRWTLYLDGLRRHGEPQSPPVTLVDTDADRTPPARDERLTLLSRHLTETVRFLQAGPAASKVILVGQPPDYAWFHYKALERGDFTAPVGQIAAWHARETQLLNEVSTATGARVIDLKPLLCDAQICQTRRQGVLQYIDDNHLSRDAVAHAWATLLAPSLTPALR